MFENRFRLLDSTSGSVGGHTAPLLLGLPVRSELLQQVLLQRGRPRRKQKVADEDLTQDGNTAASQPSEVNPAFPEELGLGQHVGSAGSVGVGRRGFKYIPAPSLDHPTRKL